MDFQGKGLKRIERYSIFKLVHFIFKSATLLFWFALVALLALFQPQQEAKETPLYTT